MREFDIDFQGKSHFPIERG